MTIRTNMQFAGLADVQNLLNDVLVAGHESVERISNFVAQSTSQRAKNIIRSSTPAGNVHFRTNPDRYVRASAPGQPPAIDTGYLISSITFKKFSSGAAYAIVGAPYGFDLEFGNLEFAPRPFFVPGFNDAVAAASGRFRKEFEALL